MALILPQETKKMNTTYVVPKDGAYRVIIKSFEDKVDDFPDYGERPNTRRGNHYFNLRVEFENGRTRFERLDYQNKEGANEPNGYNFLIEAKNILFESREVPQGLKDDLLKRDSISSDDIFGALVKYAVPFYIVYRNTKANNGNTYTNINNFFDPFYEPTQEVLEELAKRKLEIVEFESNQSDDDGYEETDSYTDNYDEDEEDEY